MRVIRARSQRQRDAAFKLCQEESQEFADICRSAEEVWLVTDRGRVVAAAGAELVNDHPVHVALTFCIVAPAARGQGLQDRLLKARLRWAEKEGVSRVTTYANRDNKPSLENLIRNDFRVYSYNPPFVCVEREI